MTKKWEDSDRCLNFTAASTGDLIFPSRSPGKKQQRKLRELVAGQKSREEYDPCPKEGRAHVTNHKAHDGHGTS